MYISRGFKALSVFSVLKYLQTSDITSDFP